MPMPAPRPLGRSGIAVRPLCFGGNVFGWTADRATSHSLLDAFVDAGFDFVDTADMYSRWVPGHVGGESERLIGDWFATSGRRDRVVLATKVGMDMGEGRSGLSAAHIERSVEASLRRLRTDYIDLYQSHKDDPTTPQEETLRAYERLIGSGKVRAIGASNFEAPRLRAALAASTASGLPRYECLQPLYNLYDREAFERSLGAACAEAGIGVIPYYSLASGFLSGKYRRPADADRSARGPGIVKRYLTPRGEQILAALDEQSARTGATLAQLAIAWLIARPGVTAPIVSATSLEQLGELLAAAQLTLDAPALAALDTASAWAPT